MDSISIIKVSKALMTYSKILTLEMDTEMARNGSFLLGAVLMISLMMRMTTMMMMTFLEDLNLVVFQTLSLGMIQISTQADIGKMFMQMNMDRDFTEMLDIQSSSNQVSIVEYSKYLAYS